MKLPVHVYHACDTTRELQNRERMNLVCNNVICGLSRTAPCYHPGVAEAPFKSKRMLSSSHLGIEVAYYDIIV